MFGISDVIFLCLACEKNIIKSLDILVAIQTVSLKIYTLKYVCKEILMGVNITLFQLRIEGFLSDECYRCIVFS